MPAGASMASLENSEGGIWSDCRSGEDTDDEGHCKKADDGKGGHADD